MLRLKVSSFFPQDFNDHIRHHMAFSRDPLLKIWADKLSVRDWAGKRFSDLKFPSLLWVGKDVGQINFEDLPEQFVLKTNHASGAIILVTTRADKAAPMLNVFQGSNARFQPIVVHPEKFDAALARKTLASWLSRDYSYRIGNLPEWCYRNIDRFAYAEEFLQNGGQPAADIKIMTANGQVVYCAHHTERYYIHEQNFFDTSWNPLEIRAADAVRSEQVPERPAHLERMIEISLEIASLSKIARVDFYEVEGQLYLGEITNYPMNGTLSYEPEYWIREFARRHF